MSTIQSKLARYHDTETINFVRKFLKRIKCGPALKWWYRPAKRCVRRVNPKVHKNAKYTTVTLCFQLYGFKINVIILIMFSTWTLFSATKIGKLIEEYVFYLDIKNTAESKLIESKIKKFGGVSIYLLFSRQMKNSVCILFWSSHDALPSQQWYNTYSFSTVWV